MVENMRVAVYNQMFALDGRSVFSNIIGHFILHFNSNPKNFLDRTDINRTVKILEKSKADILGICEIIEGQEEELSNKLGKLGYNFLFFSNGYKARYNKLRIKAGIASKIYCINKEVKGFPTIGGFGCGGGFVHCYFPSIKSNFLCVHFALMHDELHTKQMKFLQDYIKKLDGKIVLVGDFNKTYNNIKDYFTSLKLASNGHKTCSVTPIFNLFHFKDLDHIFVNGFNIKYLGTLTGFSDHKLVYADLE